MLPCALTTARKTAAPVKLVSIYFFRTIVVFLNYFRVYLCIV